MIAVLDTNILYAKPELLSRRLQGIQLVVPKIVATELAFLASKRRSMAALPEILEEAHRKRLVLIDEPPNDFVSASATHVHTLSDALILKYVEYRKRNGDEVLFVSDDRKLLQSASELGVATATSSSFPPADAIAEEPDSAIRKRVGKLLRYEIIAAVISVLAAVGTSSLASFFLPALLKLSSTFHVWGPVIGLLLLGPVVFAFRSRFRMYYGLTEFSVGLITALRVFWPAFDLTQLNAEKSFQVLGGLYIIVRGLDNIGKAIEGTPFERFWKRFEGTSTE